MEAAHLFYHTTEWNQAIKTANTSSMFKVTFIPYCEAQFELQVIISMYA